MADFPTPLRVLHNGEGTILLLADRGEITAGGHGGKVGSLRLADENNGGVIGLNAATGQITAGGRGKDGKLLLLRENGGGVIGLNADTAQVTLGGGGVAGKIRIEDANNARTLFLNGETGDISLSGADCAEEFEVIDNDTIQPGTVMVMDDEDRLRPCDAAYDKRVAGVVSGAGAFAPGIVLDRHAGPGRRLAIAISGKVYCQVDARHDAIEVGDLLTTSPTPGHAQRATDPGRAFGAVIGKAMRGLPSGTGLVPLLVALR